MRGIISDYSSLEPIFQDEFLSNGELVKWDGPFQEVFSPICAVENEPKQIMVGSYPLMDEKSSLEVLSGAEMAYGNGAGFWPTLTPKKRIEYIKRFLKELKEIKSEIIKLLMWEIGKSLKDSEKEFDRTIDYISETVSYYQRKTVNFQKPREKDDVVAYITLQPRGIILCMGPYNYPLNETFTTLIPSLITGNVVIFKPPRLGVLLHRPILKLFSDIFPPGVISTVYGEGQKVITPLMTSGKIDTLAFIGSSKVADSLKRLHPKPHRLHTVLGLEAKNPAIILDDCNLEETIKESILGSLSFNGQRCTALKIFFVESKIADQFAEKISNSVKKLTLSVPWDENAEITPMPEVSRSHFLQELIEDAKNYGAKVLNEHGGEATLTYFKPAVLYPVSSQMRIYKEEQFGPIIPIVKFENIDEITQYVIESNYGQQLSIFSQNKKRIFDLKKALGNQVTRINVNTQCQRGPDSMPFTGRKDSAEGVLSISEAIKEFTIPLVFSTRKKDKNKISYNV